MLEWKSVRLGDHCTTFSGGTPSVSNPLFYGGKIPFIKSGEIYQSFTEVNITELGLENSTSRMVEKGDLLYAIYGTGTVGNVVISQIKGAINQAILCIRSRTLNTIFLYYLLDNLKKKILDTYTQGGQGNLSAKLIQGLEIQIPPLANQEKIASILSAQDALILALKRLETKKRGIRAALMARLLAPRPEWEQVRLGEVAKITMGHSPKSSSYNDDRIGLPLIQGNADCNGRLTAPKRYTSEPTSQCQIGDIIMTVRAPVGAIAKAIQNACIGRGVCAIRAKESQEFLYYYLIFIENEWEKLAQGSTFTSVNSNEVANLQIQLPPLADQEKIASILSLADKELDALSLLITKQEGIKKALASELLSGKLLDEKKEG